MTPRDLALRVLLAAIFLGGLLAVKRERPPLTGRWGAMTLMDLTDTAAPFLLPTGPPFT